MASRVVPATSLPMTRCSPRIRLVRLDLPTLGRPQMVIIAVFVMLFIGDPQLSFEQFYCVRVN